ncbi:sensor histidine kinase [Bacillus marinisedimentorum]|uniref:sensor histidine kinase n=1 Tax=Bacillus marinisedimentorum TaxID=1821260 RepID=UPI0009F5BC39|nr:HAMP domain-containing sensor histidine kinase [Bacillus marinisedimentorum]
MIDFVKDLLLHFAIIVFLGFMYNFLFSQRREIGQRHIMLLVVLAVLVVTIVFPVEFDSGLAFDLKLIPFIITFFYIGPGASLFIIAFMAVVQAGIDLSGINMIIVNYSVMFAILYFLRKSYLYGGMQMKLGISFFVYLLITATRVSVLVRQGYTNEINYLFVFSLVSFLALAAVIYIIEMTILQNRMLDELQKAEKLTAVSQLAASVAHEIRNPMTTIKGFMQILKNEDNLTDSQNMFVRVSLQELERTQTIINNFLSLARPNTKHFQEVDLTKLLMEVVEFMKPYSHMSNIEMYTKIDEHLLVEGDPHEFRQLFINIVKNGIEAMADGGNFFVYATDAGEVIRIDIKDEGVGMSKKQVQRLGQPYYSTKDKGTGLGMLICFDIIKRISGEIIVDSKEGVGTTFTIEIPKKQRVSA